jgi:predicted peptidase
MRSLSVLLLTFAVAPALLAAEKTGFLDKTFKNADGSESPYVLFVPANYDGKTEVPLILFLHGAGETKGGQKKPVEVGLGPVLKKQEKEFPAIVIIPQAETRGWGVETANAKRALAILDTVAKEYKTDAKRTYLTGLSMGGYGTWSIVAAHPDKFAAIVPVCGGGDPNAAAKFKDVPCWVFHGDKDAAVPVQRSRDMVEALKKAGGTPKYTEYPGVGHNSWDAAYSDKEMWKWLFAQAKK